MAYLKQEDWVEGSRETLIQSQNQISYGFLYIASSSSSLHTKRRGVLIALRAVVISSVVERSFLHCDQYHIGTAGKRRLGATHILCLSVCKEDFSLTLKMTLRESDVSSSPSLLVTSHTHTKRSCEEMNPHFSQPLFTLLSFGSGFRIEVAASPPFLGDGILVSQPSPLGDAIKLRKSLAT